MRGCTSTCSLKADRCAVKQHTHQAHTHEEALSIDKKSDQRNGTMVRVSMHEEASVVKNINYVPHDFINCNAHA